jgi:hypothetical protein
VKGILLIHAAVTLMLVGLIWTIQVVHYPLFRFVGTQNWLAYENAHLGAITMLVAPLMLIELGTGFLLIGGMQGVSVPQALIGMGLIGAIWLVTMFVNVPQHNLLAVSFDAQAHTALVASNWIRTVAWTLRGALIVWMLWGAMA